MNHVQEGKHYRISECFSEYDLPGNPPPFGVGGRRPTRKELAEAVRCKTLKPFQVSHTGQSGWFRAVLSDGKIRGVCIHKRYLTEVLMKEYEYRIVASWREERSDTFTARSQSVAMEEAQRKWPQATEFQLRRVSLEGPENEAPSLRITSLSPQQKKTLSPLTKVKPSLQTEEKSKQGRDSFQIKCASCHRRFTPEEKFWNQPRFFQLCPDCRTSWSVIDQEDGVLKTAMILSNPKSTYYVALAKTKLIQAMEFDGVAEGHKDEMAAILEGLNELLEKMKP